MATDTLDSQGLTFYIILFYTYQLMVSGPSGQAGVPVLLHVDMLNSSGRELVISRMINLQVTIARDRPTRQVTAPNKIVLVRVK